MAETGLVQILEGALLAAGKPMTVAQLADLFEEAEKPDNSALREALKEVAERCEDRGFELAEVSSGFRFQVRQNLSPWIARLWHERPQKYSRALLETLALIAYRQPITRGEIEEIRGVAVSTNIVKTLHEREWIRVVGHRDVPGRPAMYATTKQFLDYFSLKSLDQLPALAEIRDLETLNTELGFSEPLPEGTDDPKEAGPELTVVGGKDHVPQTDAVAEETGLDADSAEESAGHAESADGADSAEGIDGAGDVERADAVEGVQGGSAEDAAGVTLAEAAQELQQRAPASGDELVEERNAQDDPYAAAMAEQSVDSAAELEEYPAAESAKPESQA